MPALRAIERAAAERFRDVGLPVIADAEPTSSEFLRALLRDGIALVAADADGRPVGFALAGILDRALHLYELSVAPAHGRLGLGGRLVAGIEAGAGRFGVAIATLSTFRDLPGNGPFYVRLGYREVPQEDWSPALFLLRAREVEIGLPVQRRIFMRKELS